VKSTQLRSLVVAGGVVLAVALTPAAYAEPDRTPPGARVDCSSTVTAGPAREEAFARSAVAAGVPVSVLKAVSYMESRWDSHPGKPSADGGYGPMNLTDLRRRTAPRARAMAPGTGSPGRRPSRPRR